MFLKTGSHAFCVSLSLHVVMHGECLKNTFSSHLPLRFTAVSLPDLEASFLPISRTNTFFMQNCSIALPSLAWPCEYIINTQNILEIFATVLQY